MFRHNGSALPLHLRRVGGFLPESYFVHHVGRCLSQSVNTVSPAGLPAVTSEELAQGVSPAVTSPVSSPTVTLGPARLVDGQQGAPPLSIHVVVGQDEICLGHRLGVALHVPRDGRLLRVDLGALREDSAVAGSLQSRGQRSLEVVCSRGRR